MRILNWNTWKAAPGSRNGRFGKVSAIVQGFDADIICLTEAHPETMPSGGQTITSRPGKRGWQAEGGPRKVVLWSRSGWTDVDDFGSAAMPRGRFVRATTILDEAEWTIIGVCIPWRDYPKVAPKAERTMALWEGACRYLDALREDVLPALNKRERTILLGDFNLRIPPVGYPRAGSEVDQKRQATLAGWLIPTSGIQRRFIDHVAMSTDLRVECLRFISKFAPDGQQLSDHNGVCIDLAPV